MRMSESNIVVSLVYRFSSWRRSVIVEMNIGQDSFDQKFRCCGAAKPKTHGAGKRRLSIPSTGSGCRPSMSLATKNSGKLRNYLYNIRISTEQNKRSWAEFKGGPHRSAS